MTQGDSLQTENGLGNSGFVPTVCAVYGCNGAYYTFAGSTPITMSAQAVGGTDCEQAYQGYIGGTDLNPASGGSTAPQAAISFYQASRKKNLLTLECGVNGYIHGRTAAQEYTSITNLVAAAKATGYTVIVATMTDACNNFLTAGGETWRSTLNGSITGGAVANGYTVADYAANANIGADGASQSATYFQVPCVSTPGITPHLTAAGVAIQAGIMETAMAAISFP